MARNYARGYVTEAKARDLLTSKGFVTWRAWASKGPFDLYASREDVLLLIQIKRTKARVVSQEAVTTLCRMDILGDGKNKLGMKDIMLPASCLAQVWLYSDRGVGKDLAGWRYYALDGDQLVQIPAPVADWDQDYRWQNLAKGLTGDS